MADYDPDPPTNAGQPVTEHSCATPGTDTIAAGTVLIVRNTGAGAHTVTIVCNATFDGLTVANRAVSLTAGQIKTVAVPTTYGDLNGRVGISADATPAEVKYYSIAG